MKAVTISADVIKTRRGYTGQILVDDTVVHETETSQYAHQAESDARADLAEIIEELFTAQREKREQEIAELAE